MKSPHTEGQSVLATALGVLFKELGPQKTTELWQVLSAPPADYRKAREKLFSGKSVADLYREARRFNRR